MAARSSLYSGLETLIACAAKVASAICQVIVAAMMLLITLEVISRSVFHYSFQVTDELASYLLVGLTFLGVNVALRENALFRVEFLFDRLPAPLRPVFQLAFDVLSLLVAAILEYQLVQLVLSSMSRDNRSMSILSTPLYIPQLIMPIGMAVMILMLLASIVRDVIDFSDQIVSRRDEE